jgi:hypothetical protein
MTPEEFKLRLRTSPIEEIVREVILGEGAVHVSSDNILHIGQRLAESFGSEREGVQVWVVGSAKLGFSTSEKKVKDGPLLRRYRPFRAESDIDIAVVSPHIFNAIWADLATYAYRRAPRWLPWDAGKLGSYLVHGWLRPDHFPRGVRRCDEWWDVIHSLSREARFARHLVRGGIYNSVESLIEYHTRAVRDCRNALELEE